MLSVRHPRYQGASEFARGMSRPHEEVLVGQEECEPCSREAQLADGLLLSGAAPEHRVSGPMAESL